MEELSEQQLKTRVSTFWASLRERPVPAVNERSTIEDVIQAMIRCEHSRVLYVVDDDGRLTGTISLGSLVRQAFARSHEPRIHPRSLIGLMTARTAKDMMQSKPVQASDDEEIGTVIKRMVEANIKEIPVVDRDKRVVGDLTMIDLLKFLSTPAI